MASRSNGFEAKRRRAGIVLVGPGLAIILLTAVVPLGIAFWISLTSYNMFTPPRFVGLLNYEQLLADRVFWQAVGNTLSFAFGQVGIGVVVAIAVAMLFNQSLTGGPVMRTLIYIPQAASYVVVALLWTLLLDPTVGPIARAAQGLTGERVYFLTDTGLAMPSIVVMSLWRNLGYFMIIILAALQAVPKDVLEAATVDGASAWQRFFYVTLPLIIPAVIFVTITWFLGALQMFTQAYVMTGGGPVNATKTVVYIMYEQAFAALNLGKASAIAVMLFGVVVVLSLALRLITHFMQRRA